MTRKDFAAHFTRKGGHHTKLAGLHRGRANSFRKAEMEEEATYHEQHAEAHEEMATHYSSLAQKCVKTTDAEFAKIGMAGNELEPLPQNFSFVTPDAPRAVLRTGGPPLQQPQVAEPFREIFKIEGGEE